MEPKQDDNCVFCKIVRRDISAEILYESEHSLAFLDNTPTALGHTLVIPKKHVRNIFDIDEASLAAVMETVRTIAPGVRDAVGAKGMHINSNNEEAAGQVIFHLHFHLIPRHDRSEFTLWPHAAYPAGQEEVIAEKIREALK
jgi:histidine triad (HIT) family protein